MQFSETVVFVENEKRTADNTLTRLLYERFSLVNPNALTQRINPHNMWLDAGIIECVIDKITSQLDSKALNVSDHHIVSRLSQSVLRGMNAFLIPLDKKLSNNWDIDRLIHCLHYLFPDAVVSNTCDSRSWKSLISQDSENRGIRRGIELAKIKVLYERQIAEGKQDFENVMMTLNKNSNYTTTLQCGCLSVYSILSLPGSSGYAVLEACRGYVLIRPIESLSNINMKNFNTIQISGVLNDIDANALTEMFSYCIPHRLRRKKYLQFSDLSAAVLTHICQRYNSIALPSGWWYDGTSYVDIHGSRKMQRPDIEAVAEIYLSEKNADIDTFNNLLEDARKYL
jgi:hypothetical protein